MFTVSVETHFRASHSVKLPNGSKEPSHHHKWLVIADVCSDELNRDGMVIDFWQLKAMLDSIIAEFVDISVEEVEYFSKEGSSAEIMAKYIYEKLEPKLPKTVKIEQIKVIEKPGFLAKFRK